MSVLSDLPKISSKRSPGFRLPAAKSAPLKLPKLKVPKVTDKYGSEVKVENRRIGGLSPKLLRSYSNPARFIKSSTDLKQRGSGHVPSGGLQAMAKGQTY